MNDKVRDALYHAWSKTPEGKENERTYNASYYKLHRNKIIQNVLDRRKKRKENGISLFDSITTSLDKAYGNKIAKTGGVDYRKSGETVYDMIRTTIDNGKKFLKAFKDKPLKEASSFYSKGFKWLKEHW